MPLFLVVSAAIMLNALSNLHRGSDPALALRLNPLNMEARLLLATNALAGGEAANGAELRELLEEGIRQAPADARPVSLLGVLEEQRGREARAAALFGHALRLMPTEIQALRGRLAMAVRAGEFDAAAGYLEMIGRRWAKRWTTIEPALPAILADPSARAAVSRRFDTPALRRLLVDSLAKSPETLDHARTLLLDWRGGNAGGLDPHINRITARLIEAGRPAEAYLLFRMTRAGAAAAAGGYVFNSHFALPLSHNLFDWQVKSSSGVDIAIVEPSGSAGAAAQKALRLTFLDSPSRIDNVAQYTALPPGEFRLAVRYRSEKLRMPKPLFIGLRCVESRQRLGRLPFEPGGERMTALRFSVPAQGCALQRLGIHNDLTVESWRYRYRGKLLVEAVTIAMIRE
jgi:hypothetical protein